MTNKEILQKAIEKAEKKGFNFIDSYTDLLTCDSGDSLYTELDALIECKNLVYGIIFSIDFAKAFWGEELMEVRGRFFGNICLKKYEFYLQQMVLEKEPLKYIEKCL